MHSPLHPVESCRRCLSWPDLCIEFKWMILCALLLLIPASVFAETDSPQPGFKVLLASSHLNSDHYEVDADFALRFSTESLDALDNGVPVVLAIEYEILEQRDYLWDKTVLELSDRFELRYQSLTKRHVIMDLVTGNKQSYGRRFSAVNALSQVHDRPIAFLSQLDPNKSYLGRVRIRLDIEALPAPLRLPAYLSKDWDLHSDWYTWSVQTASDESAASSQL